MNHPSVQRWNELGEFVDTDHMIRRISVDVESKLNITILGKWVDVFLLPRPAWSVVREPYNESDPKIIVFERYRHQWEPYFAHLAKWQFPDAVGCSSNMKLIGRADCVQPGYSDVRKQYYLETKVTAATAGVYVDANTETNESAIISDIDCPSEHKNRWTCAFLQLTNCSLPSDLSDSIIPNTNLRLYNSTNNGGALIMEGRYFADFIAGISTQLSLEKKSMVQTMQSLHPYVYVAPYTNNTNMLRFHGPEEHQVSEFLFMEFLFRKTYFYRRRIADLLAEFRAKYALGDVIRTRERRFVAVQLRRTDRAGYAGVNMTTFCHQLLTQRFTGVPQMCEYKKNAKRKPCKGNEDLLGCDNFGDIPFGSLTLDLAVQRAELLVGPHIRNMIVFSEDVEWLEREVNLTSAMHPNWKFYTLDAPVKEEYRVDGNQRFEARTSGTPAGVFFHATLALVRECEALLGHFNSGVPMTLAGAMCHHHADMEGVCPPVYNLKLPL